MWLKANKKLALTTYIRFEVHSDASHESALVHIRPPNYYIGIRAETLVSAVFRGVREKKKTFNFFYLLILC